MEELYGTACQTMDFRDYPQKSFTLVRSGKREDEVGMWRGGELVGSLPVGVRRGCLKMPRQSTALTAGTMASTT